MAEIPERALEILRTSKRYFFVADGGNESPTMVYGTNGEVADLIFLLLRFAEQSKTVGYLIQNAAMILDDSTAAHVRAQIRDLDAEGEVENLL